MSAKMSIRYALEEVSLSLPAEHTVSGRRGPSAPALADVSAAMQRVLEQPLGFPPFRQALTPDDRIAIVLCEGLSQATRLILPVLEHLADAGLDLARTTVLCPPRVGDAAGQPWHDELPLAFKKAQVEVHDPTDRGRLSYLATTGAGRRIYLNRTLVDADQVVILGRACYDPVMGYGGGLGDLFPAMSDAETRAEFFAKHSDAVPGPKAWPTRQEAGEVGWLIGMPFVLEVIEGAGDALTHVVGGAADAVAAETMRLLDLHWRVAIDRPVDLVVATISGDPRRHTFFDVTRAFANAARAVRPGGKVVLLSRARAAFGPSVAYLRQCENPAEGLALVRKLKLADTTSAWQLAAASHQAQLYLLSDIPADTAEELFVVPLERADQVQRLIDAADSCFLLPDAHRALPVLDQSPRSR